MKCLVVEDDFTCRLLLQRLLLKYGEAHVAVNGTEAVSAIANALNAGEPYNLVCLDITIPELDGLGVLKQMRAMEKAKGTRNGCGMKVIMTTSSKDVNNVFSAFSEQCDVYLTKPINNDDLMRDLRKLRLIV